MSEFVLHPRLAADTVPVGRLELSRLLLMNDANYPWCILVPERPGVCEIYQLTEHEQGLLLRESSRLGRVMMERFGGEKLNVAALGNRVPQLHLHHIVRYSADPAWPDPVWGRLPARPYPPSELAQRLAVLREALGLAGD